MEWISVKDRLPDEIDPIIVYAKNEYGGFTKKIAIREEHMWFNWETHKYLPHPPKYWMPLPESPKND